MLPLATFLIVTAFFGQDSRMPACDEYRSEIKQLEKLVLEHHEAVSRIFHPCDDNCPPEGFVLEATERKRRFPKVYEHYDLAEQEFLHAVKSTLQPPKEGKMLVEIVAHSWRFALVELDHNGRVVLRGGAPESTNLEIIGSAPREGNAALKNECGLVWIQQGTNSVLLAKGFMDKASGKKLGEVQILIVARSKSIQSDNSRPSRSVTTRYLHGGVSR